MTDNDVRQRWLDHEGFGQSLNIGSDGIFETISKVVKPFDYLLMNTTNASLIVFLNNFDSVQTTAEKDDFVQRIENLLTRDPNAPPLDPVERSLYNNSYQSSKDATGLLRLKLRYHNRQEIDRIQNFSDDEKFEYVRRTLRERIDDCKYIYIETVRFLLRVHVGLWRGQNPGQNQALVAFRVGADHQVAPQFLINAPRGSSVGERQEFERNTRRTLANFVPDAINQSFRNFLLEASLASRGAVRSPDEILPVETRPRGDNSDSTSSISSGSAARNNNNNNNNNGGNGGGGAGPNNGGGGGGGGGGGAGHNNNNNGGNGGGGRGGAGNNNNNNNNGGH